MKRQAKKKWGFLPNKETGNNGVQITVAGSNFISVAKTGVFCLFRVFKEKLTETWLWE